MIKKFKKRKFYVENLIIIITFLILLQKIFCIEQFPDFAVYSGYSEDSFVTFINPSGNINIAKFDFSCRYGKQFPGLIENNISNTDIFFKYNYKRLNFGLGYRGVSVESIFSEEMLILNFSGNILKDELRLGLNFKNYLYKYFLDEYYTLDSVANSSQQSINIDLGFRYKISEKFFSSLSYNNILKNLSGHTIKYSYPQKLVLGFGYRFYFTILNLEFINTNYEVDTKIFNNSKYRLGIEQMIFDTKTFNSTIKFGVDKSEEYTAFILSPVIKVYSPTIEVQYLWSYPVTGIKDYFGNHFIIIKLLFGSKVKKFTFKNFYIQPYLVEDTEEKNKLKATILEQENQIKQLQDSIKKLEHLKSEKTIVVTTKTVVIPVEVSSDGKKQSSLPKVESILQKPKFPLAHKVSSGETLISIAEKYYNNKSYWTKIYEANKDKIIKGVLVVGETIVIPEP